MTKKQLTDKIKCEIPHNLDEETTAAYIMKEIAQDRSFSEHYYWGNSETIKKIYKLSKDNRNIETLDKRKIICVTISRLFKSIAGEMGLDVYYVDEEGTITKNGIQNLEIGEHVYPVIKLKDNRIIKCDLQRDLTNIQTGFHWRNFGTKGFGEGFLSTLSEEKIDEIMRKIGTISDDKGYTEDYCRQQKSNIGKNITTTEIVKSVFTDNRLNEEVKKTSVGETFKFYRKVFEIYIGKDRPDERIEASTLFQTYKEKLFIFPCNIVKGKISRYTICAYTFENKDITSIYLLSRTDKSMLPVTLEELKYFENEGLRIGITSKGSRHLTRKLEEISEKRIPNIRLNDLVEERTID